MKCLVIASLFSLTALAQAAEWVSVAQTEGCPEKVEILAKEGEKYVRAVHNGKERKLFSEDGSAFSAESLGSTQFHSDAKKEKYLLGDATYTYTQPGKVEGNPPKMDVFMSGKKEHCRMAVK